MEVFQDFLGRIENPENRARTEEILSWVFQRFPNLVPRVAWNQPMFTDHGTFIIAFSVARKHLAVAPERAVIARFSEDILASGYDCTKELVRIPWTLPVNYALLEKMIEFNIVDKADTKTFWRK